MLTTVIGGLSIDTMEIVQSIGSTAIAATTVVTIANTISANTNGILSVVVATTMPPYTKTVRHFAELG